MIAARYDSSKESKHLASPLYPSLLGPAWAKLAFCIRQCHAHGDEVRLCGRFRIDHGRVVARFLARLLRLPPTAESAETVLSIIPSQSGETWSRSFAGHRLISWQSIGPGGLLCERIGRLELYFTLHAATDSLAYESAGVRIRIGSRSIHIPKCARPVVSAREEASGPLSEQNHVSVEVRLPWLGRLIRYEGCLSRGGGAP